MGLAELLENTANADLVKDFILDIQWYLQHEVTDRALFTGIDFLYGVEKGRNYVFRKVSPPYPGCWILMRDKLGRRTNQL